MSRVGCKTVLEFDMEPKVKLAEINTPRQKSYFAVAAAGLVIASMLIVVITMPELWYFVLMAAVIGVAALFIVRMTNRDEGSETALMGGARPEIDVAKIKVGGGVAGAIFTLGSMWIFLTGIPALWYFLALAIAVGAGIAVALRFTDPAR